VGDNAVRYPRIRGLLPSMSALFCTGIITWFCPRSRRGRPRSISRRRQDSKSDQTTERRTDHCSALNRHRARFYLTTFTPNSASHIQFIFNLPNNSTREAGREIEKTKHPIGSAVTEDTVRAEMMGAFPALVTSARALDGPPELRDHIVDRLHHTHSRCAPSSLNRGPRDDETDSLRSQPQWGLDATKKYGSVRGLPPEVLSVVIL